MKNTLELEKKIPASKQISETNSTKQYIANAENYAETLAQYEIPGNIKINKTTNLNRLTETVCYVQKFTNFDSFIKEFMKDYNINNIKLYLSLFHSENNSSCRKLAKILYDLISEFIEKIPPNQIYTPTIVKSLKNKFVYTSVGLYTPIIKKYKSEYEKIYIKFRNMNIDCLNNTIDDFLNQIYEELTQKFTVEFTYDDFMNIADEILKTNYETYKCMDYVAIYKKFLKEFKKYVDKLKANVREKYKNSPMQPSPNEKYKINLTKLQEMMENFKDTPKYIELEEKINNIKKIKNNIKTSSLVKEINYYKKMQNNTIKENSTLQIGLNNILKKQKINNNIRIEDNIKKLKKYYYLNENKNKFKSYYKEGNQLYQKSYDPIKRQEIKSKIKAIRDPSLLFEKGEKDKKIPYLKYGEDYIYLNDKNKEENVKFIGVKGNKYIFYCNTPITSKSIKNIFTVKSKVLNIELSENEVRKHIFTHETKHHKDKTHYYNLNSTAPYNSISGKLISLKEIGKNTLFEKNQQIGELIVGQKYRINKSYDIYKFVGVKYNNNDIKYIFYREPIRGQKYRSKHEIDKDKLINVQPLPSSKKLLLPKNNNKYKDLLQPKKKSSFFMFK